MAGSLGGRSNADQISAPPAAYVQGPQCPSTGPAAGRQGSPLRNRASVLPTRPRLHRPNAELLARSLQQLPQLGALDAGRPPQLP
jgi:hypothetical protein